MGWGAQVKHVDYCGDFLSECLFRSTRVDGAALWGFCGEEAFIIHPRQGKHLVPCQRGEHNLLSGD